MHELIARFRLWWVIAALAACSVFLQLRMAPRDGRQIFSDRVRENYECLPAIFSGNSTEVAGEVKVSPNCPRRLGMTASYLPFFIFAHFYAHISGDATNGYSVPYQTALNFSSLIYIIIGLVFLHKTLRLHFAEHISAFAIACICFGSNLLYFVNMAAGSSHHVGFMLISMFLYFTIMWHQDRDLRASAIVGLLGGAMALVRPVDLWVFLFFFLYEVRSVRSLFYKLKIYRRHISQLVFIACVVMAVWLLQPLTCRTFFSDNPVSISSPSAMPEFILQLGPSLMIYAPLLLFSVAGFFALGGNLRRFLAGALVFSVAYFLAAVIWWISPYGGTFGYRTIVDIYPVLALPFTALLVKMLNLGEALRRILYLLIVIFLSLNIWLTFSLVRKGGVSVQDARASVKRTINSRSLPADSSETSYFES